MSKEQKREIIERAGQLSSQTQFSRQQIIRQIAKEIGKGQETIRIVLLKYQKSNPNKAAAIRKLKGRLETTEAAEIDRLYRQGAGIAELMRKFDRSRSSIFRILKQRRIQALLAKKIEFIYSDEFAGEDAQEEITGPREVLQILDKRLMPRKKEGAYGDYIENLIVLIPQHLFPLLQLDLTMYLLLLQYIHSILEVQYLFLGKQAHSTH